MDKHWDNEYRNGGSIKSYGEVWITNALTTDKRILSEIFDYPMTHEQLYDHYKKQGYEIKESQIHKITNRDVLQNYKDALANYIKKKFSKNINWDLTLIPYSVVQDKMIIGSHSVSTSDGEIEINPNDLFDSFANGGGIGNDWFWNHAYRHYMRDASLEQRNKVKAQFIKEGLELDGESPRHSAIISSIVGEYANGGGIEDKFYEGGKITDVYKSDAEVINSILEKTEPKLEELLNLFIEDAEKKGNLIDDNILEIVKLNLIMPLVKALGKYIKNDDKLDTISVYSGKGGTIEIRSRIIRDGKSYRFNTDMIIASGLIQKAHYRYLVDTNLNYNQVNKAENEIKEKIKRLTKLESLNLDLKNNKTRLSEMIKKVEYRENIAKGNDDEIYNFLKNKANSEGKEFFEFPAWEEIVRRGADKNYNYDQREYQARVEDNKKNTVESFKRGIFNDKNWIKDMKKTIKKLESKIAELKPENKMANGGGVGSENFYALTSDGMRNKKRVKILKVQYWKGRETNHAPTLENIKEFLLQVPFDEKIVIYADEDYIDDSTSFYGQLHSAYTPLYTAGAITVDAIVDENNNMIWNLYAKGKYVINVDDYKFKNGGGVERIDLFEDYENIPTNIQEILDEYSQDFEDGNYDGLAKALEEVESQGYTFEYYLDGQAYGLRPIGVPLNELKGYEDMGKEYANGGAIKTDFNELQNTELRNVLISFWNDFFNNNIGNYLSIEKENYILSNIDNVFVIVRDEDKGNFSNVEKQNIDRFLSPYFDSDKKPLFTDFFNNYEIKDNKIIIYIKDMYANGGGVDSYPFNLTILVSNKDYAKIVIQKHNGVILNESQRDYGYEFALGSYDWRVLDKIADELYDKGFFISQYAKGGGVGKSKKQKGDIGKYTGKQYAYTLSEAEKAFKPILVSPTDYWKKEEGSVYTDSFGRRQVVRESSKLTIMTGYAYRIMILLDLESDKVPASAKKYAMSVYEFAPNEISAKLYEYGGGVETTDYSDLAFASKTFSKTSEMLVRENLNNGEICMCKLTKILGHEPNYPIQIVGSLKLEKCFMKRFYRIV